MLYPRLGCSTTFTSTGSKFEFQMDMDSLKQLIFARISYEKRRYFETKKDK